MATGRWGLPVMGAIFPDATGTGNAPATLVKVVSSGTQTANTPKVTPIVAAFDAATDEHLLWQFSLPADYASGGTIRLIWGAVPISGNVVWKAGCKPFDLTSTDLDAAVFVAADLLAATAVPGTSLVVREDTIALTMTGASAGDAIQVFVGRDADNGSDTAAGDAYLFHAVFEYTV